MPLSSISPNGCCSIHSRKDTIKLPAPNSARQAFIDTPTEQSEWIDGQITTKERRTIRHGVVQGRLSHLWATYAESLQDAGAVCVEAPCCTLKQIRRPDVAFITAELLAKHGQPATFPNSFPLIAEIISPTDLAEATFAKAVEYLEAGCQEVWLVMPEVQRVLIMTATHHLWLTADETATTQTILKGFQIRVRDLVK